MAQRILSFAPSSNIEAVAYDEETQELFITFKGGRQYKYTGVDSNEADSLSRADSAGKYVNDVIKPLYPCEPL